MKYKVKVEPQALADIQEITHRYNEKQVGLGKRFVIVANTKKNKPT